MTTRRRAGVTPPKRRMPSKEALLDWLRDNPGATGKREIARAFGLKGADRLELKRLLAELEDEGQIERRRRRARPADALPPVTLLVVTRVGPDGELFAAPASWDGPAPAPVVLVLPRRVDGAMGPGDRLLAKLRRVAGEDHGWEARPIKRIAATERRLLGIYRAGRDGGRVQPVDKRAPREWSVPAGETGGAADGELVEAAALEGPRLGLPRGRVVARHGRPSDARQVSLIAMVEHGIPQDFPAEAEREAAAARPVRGLGRREDLRDLPLVTIDPADARDHDDAVLAAPDDDPKNPGGHVVWVAIADVAYYVRPGSALDAEARARGNSTYFPDRVSPMLPERLSADLCSLGAGVARPCLAVRMVLDAEGNKIAHRFARGLMRSAATLNYPDVQAAVDGEATAIAPELVDGTLRPLYAAYRAVRRARDRRAPLDLDLPERRIEISDTGEVTSIGYRQRLDAHRLVEEFMILANVAAAETLEAKRSALIYRVHEEPDPEKVEALRETLGTMGMSLAKGQVLRTAGFNRLLDAARGTEQAEAVGMAVLRAQMQANYAPRNLGHFGLNLARYAHFTSPIRRYADLIVHRALIAALEFGNDGLGQSDIQRLDETAEHISMTERRSMEAERDTAERYVAAYLADRVGGELEGRIAGVSRAGVFVRLDETGADGLVPISSLGSDYFHHDRNSQTLTGERTGRVLGLGMPVTVRLREAAPVTGGLILELISVDGGRLAVTLRGKAASGRKGAGGRPKATARRGRPRRAR